MKKIIAALVLLTAASLQARADYENRAIGNWIVSATEDRLGDGGAFVALTLAGDHYALGVRCLEKHLSIGIMDASTETTQLAVATVFKLKFRIDKQPVVEAGGVAVDERLIEVVTEKSLVKAMRNGKETAIKIENSIGVSSTHIFKMAGAPKAFADLSKECPLD